MFKAVIKEIFIIILLIIAILLILGILFYEYNPNSKKVPTAVAEYNMPKELQEELRETIETSEKQNIIHTYRVEAEDLRVYENSEDYVKGKLNPFSNATTQNNNTNNNNTDGNSTGDNSTGGTGIHGNFLNTIK